MTPQSFHLDFITLSIFPLSAHPVSIILGIFIYSISFLTSWHILLHKRDPRSASGWIFVSFILPLVGPFLYLVLGINRLRRRQEKKRTFFQMRGDTFHSIRIRHAPHISHFHHSHQTNSLIRAASGINARPVVGNNRISLLNNGEEAYPAMIDAINSAVKKVYLSTFIFESNLSGLQFIQALKGAVDRGVDVKVIIDGIGNLYHFPRASRLFKKNKIPFRLFLPISFLKPSWHINLRTHHKILVVDDHIGFTGGMNIGDRHCVKLDLPGRVQDTHFKIDGPVVHQLEQAFLKDWHFAGHEKFEEIMQVEESNLQDLCRGVTAGPDEDFETIKIIFLAGINHASKKIRIITPYFIPDQSLISALIQASLKGIEVELIVPYASNLFYISWACQAFLGELLQFGVKVFYQPPPFNHTRYMVIDDYFSFIGSANLDPRSLRLNFEFNLEVYSESLASQLATHFDAIKMSSQTVTLDAINSRSLAQKTRDSLAKLFSPYF